MSTDAPATPPRKKRRIWRWLGIAALLFLAWFCWQLFGPNPPIIVSRETTYITEPLGPDGLPDYEKYVLDKYREGVTPENNAAVLLWQVIWPGELEPPQYQAMVAELGLKQAPLAEKTIAPILGKANVANVATWLEKRADTAMDDDADAEWHMSVRAKEIIEPAFTHPWTSEQIPPLAQWVEENKSALNLAVEASGRPRYCSPSPAYLDNERTPFFAVVLPDVQGVRDTARGLLARAMWNLGEDRLHEVWADLLAAHRLARLLSQSQTLVEQMNAFKTQHLACSATLQFLDGELSSEQARKALNDLSSLHQFDAVAGCFDQFERIGVLDGIIHVHLSPADCEYAFDIGPFSIDWNVALREGNRCYDRMATAARLPKYGDRQKALDEIWTELKLRNDFDHADRGARFLLDRTYRSEFISTILVYRIIPDIMSATEAQVGVNTELELTRLAAALAVYRAEHGIYPESLDALVPNIVAKLPVDLYHETPFFYRREGEGYLLYSAGPNGVDDGGSSEIGSIFWYSWDFDEAEHEQMDQQIPAGADDLSIRVPVPPFKLPEPSSK